MRKARQTVLELAGREVVITNPDKPFFPQAGHTKLHLVRYYAAVAEGALRGIAGRPIVLKRYVDGAAGEPFFQKRAPEQRPEWIETVELRFPSGRTAREIVVRDAAQLLWMVNLGCIDLNPHPVRADDLEHPDELRVDLDPGPGVSWDFVRRVTLLVRDVLDEQGLRGWPKTSGSRGMHVNVRIQRRWSFEQVRRAALALAREVEQRAPVLASSKWWKEERRGVFLDYNRNAKDRTVAAGWVRVCHISVTIHLPHGIVGALRQDAVGQPAGVFEELLDRRLTLGRLELHIALAIGPLVHDSDLEVVQIGEVLRNRVIYVEPPFLPQHHDGHANDWLRHRIDAENGVFPHGRSVPRILRTNGLEISDLSVPNHQDHGAWQFA